MGISKGSGVRLDGDPGYTHVTRTSESFPYS
jgi:hypothetical protein